MTVPGQENLPPNNCDGNDSPSASNPVPSETAVENEPDSSSTTITDDIPPQQQQQEEIIPPSTGIEIENEPTIRIPATSVERRPDTVKCRFLPHGLYAVMPALFSTFAWLASLTQDGCDYARLTGPIVTQLTNDPEIPFLDVGFNQFRAPEPDPVTNQWIVDYRLPCEDYNSDVVTMDGYWKLSKGTAFLSLVFGGGGALFLWFSSCFVFSRGTWRWAGYELLAATIFQALSFLWFLTSMCHGNEGEDECSLYYGSKTDILAAIFWGVSVLAIFGRYPKATNKALGDSSNRRGVGDVEVPNEVEMTDQVVDDELPLEGRASTNATLVGNGATRTQAGDHEII